MNTELFKQIYMGAVVVLAGVAVLHVLNGSGGKGKCKDPNQLTPPLSQVNPTWFSPGPVIKPRVSSRKSHMTIAPA